MRKRTLTLLVVSVGLLLPLSVAVQRLAGIPLTVTAVAARSVIPADGEWIAHTNGNEINGLAVEGDNIWAATQGGVVRWDRTDGTYVKYTTSDGLADNLVNGAAIDSEGHRWFGTWGGVCEYDGSSWTTYTTADGLRNDKIHAIAIEAQSLLSQERFLESLLAVREGLRALPGAAYRSEE
jgi:ligand-binding sensor domain-containing protein